MYIYIRYSAPRKWRENKICCRKLFFAGILFVVGVFSVAVVIIPALSVVAIVNALTSPTATLSMTNAPTLSPITEQQQQQLPVAVACHFLKLTDMTTCQSTTFFIGHPVERTIPTEIGLLTQLTFLYLVDSNISGPIPSTLGNLANLTSLYLH